MKTSYLMNSIIFILLMSFTLSAKSESELFTGKTQNHAQLPSGITQDWLSNTRDESGNKIFSNNEYFPGQDNPPEIPYNLAMNGEAANNSFGNSVSGAGDVNNDGYADVIVGAYGYSSARGRAYIFFGGSPMNNVADITLTGELNGNNFGWSVSAAGDINNDGYADVIVGASGYSSFTGRAYIFLGGSPMNNVADVIMTGEATNNSFGTSVSTGGDVNGDGYSDVIVGASSYSSSTGRAYVYFGSSFMDNTADVIMTGEFTNNDFGTSVSSAGDVNGDFYSDVIIGASNYSSATGRAYIYFRGYFYE